MNRRHFLLSLPAALVAAPKAYAKPMIKEINYVSAYPKLDRIRKLWYSSTYGRPINPLALNAIYGKLGR